MKNFKIHEATKKIIKTETEVKKQLEESIMSNKNVNTDIEKLARKVQNRKEAAEIVKEMVKTIKSNKWGKVFENGSKFCGRQPLNNLISPLLNTLSQI